MGPTINSPFPSPDGLRMAFVSDRSGRWNVWLKELSSGRETALPPAEVEAYMPVFAHDGSRLVYQAGPEYLPSAVAAVRYQPRGPAGRDSAALR